MAIMISPNLKVANSCERKRNIDGPLPFLAQKVKMKTRLNMYSSNTEIAH